MKRKKFRCVPLAEDEVLVEYYHLFLKLFHLDKLLSKEELRKFGIKIDFFKGQKEGFKITLINNEGKEDRYYFSIIDFCPFYTCYKYCRFPSCLLTLRFRKNNGRYSMDKNKVFKNLQNMHKIIERVMIDNNINDDSFGFYFDYISKKVIDNS